MLGLNSIQIIGNLGGTPDLKFLNDGRSQVVNFSVAVNERWKNRDGDPQERTTWLRIVDFKGVGQACAEHLTKGDGVYVEVGARAVDGFKFSGASLACSL